jgi:carbonic anhydrase/acetyltransferase-like protein (isoleucine patch superfamily)
MSRSDLLVMPYAGTTPTFGSAPRSSRGAAVLGRASLGKGAVLGEYAVIRADGHYVAIGDNFWLGRHATVHIAHNVYPTHIGDNVTALQNSIIHACDVGSNCFIGRDVVVLDGSKVADDVVLADGSIVFPRSVLESGWLYAGQPAKPVRRLEPGELQAARESGRTAIEDDRAAVAAESSIDSHGDLFLALTARTQGHFSFGAGVGIWFGCDLDAGHYRISVGDGANIQDNTIIRSAERPVTIGRQATIGHNVTMVDCEVADRSLIGMGANVAAGTLVQEDVLLAAGACTTPGQILESGWLYGGRPARQLSKLDENKRRIITSTWPVYMDYARSFDAAQAASNANAT